MRTLLAISMLCLTLMACTRTPQDVRTVWTQPGAPHADLPAPAGFTITPLQAHFIVWNAYALSLKHIWHIYADTRFYYVHDTFLSEGPHRAYTLGVRVDGRTGEIVKR